VLGLSRVISPRLDKESVPPATRDTVVAVSSTIGAANTSTLAAPLWHRPARERPRLRHPRRGDVPAAAAVLAVMGLCAFVLDAFEIIFIIVPILMPPLLVRMADARWVSVLLLLTLQSSFLLPPFGYALMMLRGAAKDPVRVLRACACPFLGCAAVRSARGADGTCARA
jgi:hypothetical protein